MKKENCYEFVIYYEQIFIAMMYVWCECVFVRVGLDNSFKFQEIRCGFDVAQLKVY